MGGIGQVKLVTLCIIFLLFFDYFILYIYIYIYIYIYVYLISSSNVLQLNK